MSDLLAAAAAALGIPESLVQRSAAAKATETGATIDEVLAAWAGGGDVAAPTAQPAAAPAPEASPAETSVEPAPIAVVTAPAAPPIQITTVPYKAPVLVGARDNTMAVIIGAVGLFLVVLLVGLFGPSIALDSPGARTSELAFSQAALDGRELYGSLGCAACHTQLVRPVIADVGLGLVTLNDSNQVIGARRFGPDLSDVGSRMSNEEIQSSVAGGTGVHPPHDLADDDMGALIAYLTESRTTEG